MRFYACVACKFYACVACNFTHASHANFMHASHAILRMRRMQFYACVASKFYACVACNFTHASSHAILTHAILRMRNFWCDYLQRKKRMHPIWTYAKLGMSTFWTQIKLSNQKSKLFCLPACDPHPAVLRVSNEDNSLLLSSAVFSVNNGGRWIFYKGKHIPRSLINIIFIMKNYKLRRMHENVLINSAIKRKLNKR